MNNRALLRVDGNLITLQTLFKGPNKEFGMRNSFYSVKVHHKTLLRTSTKEYFITSYLCIKKPYQAPKSTQIWTVFPNLKDKDRSCNSGYVHQAASSNTGIRRISFHPFLVIARADCRGSSDQCSVPSNALMGDGADPLQVYHMPYEWLKHKGRSRHMVKGYYTKKGPNYWD